MIISPDEKLRVNIVPYDGGRYLDEEIVGFVELCCASAPGVSVLSPEELDKIKGMEKAASGPFLLAQSEDGIVGLLVAFRRADPSNLPVGQTGLALRMLCVHPRMRRRGIAGSLLDRCVAMLRGSGTEEIEVAGLDSRNEPAIRFFEVRGWSGEPQGSVRMVRDLVDLPPVRIPEGYTLRTFRPGDEVHWVRIHNAAFATETPKSRAWTVDDFHREFTEDRYYRPERIFFAVHKGVPAGTTSAWVTQEDGRDYGMVHWVAVTPEHRGKGLGCVLVTRALHHLKAEGFDRAYLSTNTGYKAAIRVYRQVGFEMAYQDVTFRKRLVGNP